MPARASSAPRAGSPGVVNDLYPSRRPEEGFTITTSVNVPPMSSPTTQRPRLIAGKCTLRLQE
jgi:hypothetical protein